MRDRINLEEIQASTLVYVRKCLPTMDENRRECMDVCIQNLIYMMIKEVC